MIEVVHDGLDVAISDLIEGYFFGEELTDQTIHIFIGAALP